MDRPRPPETDAAAVVAGQYNTLAGFCKGPQRAGPTGGKAANSLSPPWKRRRTGAAHAYWCVMDPPGPSGVAAGDGPGPEALALLWRENRAWIAAVLYAHRPREVDVEDLLQEVALTLVRHAGGVDLERARPWLRRVAINCARDAGRRAKVRRRPLPALGEREKRTGDGGPDALGAVMGLPVEYREPMLLSLRGLSQRVIAEVMEVPVTTVETRLVRARRMVREALALAVEERV